MIAAASLYGLAGFCGLLLFAYLLYALIRAEEF